MHFKTYDYMKESEERTGKGVQPWHNTATVILKVVGIGIGLLIFLTLSSILGVTVVATMTVLTFMERVYILLMRVVTQEENEKET